VEERFNIKDKTQRKAKTRASHLPLESPKKEGRKKKSEGLEDIDRDGDLESRVGARKGKGNLSPADATLLA